MDTTSQSRPVSSTRIATAATLAAFAGFVAVSDSLRIPALTGPGSVA